MNLIRYALMLSCSLVAQGANAAWVNIDELNADDLAPGTAGVHFGQSVAADIRFDGTIRALYVGAPSATVIRNNVTYPGAGAVYVLVQSGGQWEVIGRIETFGSYLQANSHFGAAVAVHRGTIAVGEPDYDNAGHPDTGRVVFFRDTQWNSELPPLIDSIGTRNTVQDNARMGASVAVTGGGINTDFGGAHGSDGSFVLVGAPGDGGTGCVYVNHYEVDFNLSGNNQEYVGTVCAENAGDAFGASVAAKSLGDGQVSVIVGAPGTVQNGNATAGAAYAYVRVNGTLTLIDTLVAPNPTLFDFFGTSVAIDHDDAYIFVGATGRDLAGVGRTGSVSLFEPAFLLGYDFVRELFPSTPRAAGDLCGATVNTDFSGADGFVMGCPGADVTVTNQGAARVYRPFVFMGNTAWTNQRIFLDEEPHGADDFGRSVILVNDRLYAGAPYANDAVGADNGAVFEFANGLVIDGVFANSFEN